MHILSMEIYNKNTLLTEGARDRALEQFMPLLQKRGIQMSISQLKQTLMSKFVNEANIHNLSLDSNYYLLGVARYYFNGDLTLNKRINLLYPNVTDRFNTEVCQRLDALILILRNAYIDSVGTKWEQPEDFGTLTIDKLLRKYNAKINKELGLDVKPETNVPAQVEKPTVSDDYTAGKNYTYDILYSFEDATKYNQATTPGAWCITYGRQHYAHYIKKFGRYGGIHYVVFRQNGFENIPRQVGPGFTKRKPHDAYGNSLICVLQRNDSPEPTFITSRWNHGYGSTQGTEADHAYNTQEFLQTIGCDYSVLERAYEQWKVNSNYGDKSEEERKKKAEERAEGRIEKASILRAMKYMQMLINGGANPFLIQIPGFMIKWKPFGWAEKEWANKIGVEYLEPENAPQKYAYILSVRKEEGGNSFSTIMDRKKLLFDQFFSTSASLRGIGESFITVGGYGWFSLYDRKRHCFFDIEGVTKFKYASPDYGFTYERHGYNIDIKYLVVAISGNQLALINLKTMKPIKARNGSAWFESIYSPYNPSNHNYRGGINLPGEETVKSGLLKLVYDSASGEEYFFNPVTDSFVDPYKGIPEGWYLYTTSRCELNSPGKRYLTYIDNKDLLNDYWVIDNKNIGKLFRNTDDDSIFSVNGLSVFGSISIKGCLVAYMEKSSEDVYYYDMETNKPLELNGQPVITKYGTDTIHTQAEYITISYARYYKGEDGKARYGNGWKKVLLYNPYTHDFYHDDISGYFFNVYGGNDNWVHAYIPADKVNSVPEHLKPNFGSGRMYELYKIPNAMATAENRQANESKIGRIILETLFTELKKLL